MENKKCTRCKELKSVKDFYPRRERGLVEYRPKCKKCCSEIQKLNKEKTKEYVSKSYKKHKEKRLLYAQDYRKNNVKKIKETEFKRRKKYKEKRLAYSIEYTRERRKNDSLFYFRHKTSNAVLYAFKRKGFLKSTDTEKILGCSIQFFYEFINSQFKKGMSFENYGKWHLDHIIPLSTAKTEKEVIILNHYTNFQPLWANENLIKSNKIITKQLKLI